MIQWELGEAKVSCREGWRIVPALVSRYWAIHSKVMIGADRVNSATLVLTHRPTGFQANLPVDDVSQLAAVAEAFELELDEDALAATNPTVFREHGQPVVIGILDRDGFGPVILRKVKP